MKRTLIIFLTAFAIPCSAQWKDVEFNEPILAFGVHDTTLFVSQNGHVDRYEPWEPNIWYESDGGIDFTQGNVTSFASLGNYFFAGMYDGPAYISSNDGASWTLNCGGPVSSNGRYVFSGEGGYGVYRSRDSGTVWDSINRLSVGSFASIGTYIFATSNGLMRSTDTGNTWTKISPPFANTMTVMGSLLFMTDTGSVAVTTDSGTKWQAVPVDTAGEYEHVTVLVTDGKNLFAGTGNGVLVSTDSGHTWRNGGEEGLPSNSILTLGVFDTLLFCQVQGSRGQLYTAVRPIPQMTTDSPASVVQLQLPGDTIEIYPNPASGVVTIISGGTSIFGVSVLNVLGEDVKDELSQRQSDITLDVSKLPSGTYFMQIETANGTVLRKVVIQH